MEALADMIKSRTPYFDIFLLTELWMQADHQLLADAAKNVSLHMTEFSGVAGPSTSTAGDASPAVALSLAKTTVTSIVGGMPGGIGGCKYKKRKNGGFG